MKERSQPFSAASAGTSHFAGSFPFTRTRSSRRLPCPFLWSLSIDTLLLADKKQTVPQSHISQTALILLLSRGRSAYRDCQTDQPFPETPAPLTPSSLPPLPAAWPLGIKGLGVYSQWSSRPSLVWFCYVLHRARPSPRTREDARLSRFFWALRLP